eukprot:CAMPEP_0116065150 /NCGR_PEP_ID=MMETSP0322-20121206/9562_1 /TAXON_ID=163516 /ORGANISM="Leptocylindrus danicus var. apora, Strain B651" /LENGTH=226 /DNA_ID=CAMNT_0003551351 /DNA_START=58 /DNA_END=738 /DNA_ORIENTATION=+
MSSTTSINAEEVVDWQEDGNDAVDNDEKNDTTANDDEDGEEEDVSEDQKSAVVLDVEVVNETKVTSVADEEGEEEEEGDEDDDNDGDGDGDDVQEDDKTNASISNNSPPKAKKQSKRPKASPEHRERLLAQLARGRETARKNRESGACALPLRNIKRIMRLNKDVGIVQNEAAILVQFAAELFTKKFANQSFKTAQEKGRDCIKYEDVAEARAASAQLSFLEPLIP